jgi:hypothetical protein
MKRNLLSRLRTNGACYIVGALLLLIGVPLYQALVLTPQGYGGALRVAVTQRFAPYLLWIGVHSLQFIFYRALLVVAFVLLLTLPFTLFRIIVAQEILEQQDEEPEGDEEVEDDEELEDDEKNGEEAENDEDDAGDKEGESGGMPSDAWRGKGLVVLGAWTGIIGLSLYVLATIASTFCLATISSSFVASAHGGQVPGNFSALSSTFAILSNTVGVGLLALSILFFGGRIARRGLKLWPGIWVAFAYVALAVGLLLSASAVAIATTSAQGQTILTTPAILLFALWMLWLGIMLVRLKPE